MFRTLAYRQTFAPGRQLISSGFFGNLRSVLLKGFQPIQQGLHFIAGVSHGVDSFLSAASHLPIVGSTINAVRSNPFYNAVTAGIDTVDQVATGLVGSGERAQHLGMMRPPSRMIDGYKRLKQ
jgi:hypothetical protein